MTKADGFGFSENQVPAHTGKRKAKATRSNDPASHLQPKSKVLHTPIANTATTTRNLPTQPKRKKKRQTPYRTRQTKSYGSPESESNTSPAKKRSRRVTGRGNTKALFPPKKETWATTSHPSTVSHQANPLFQAHEMDERRGGRGGHKPLSPNPMVSPVVHGWLLSHLPNIPGCSQHNATDIPFKFAPYARCFWKAISSRLASGSIGCWFSLAPGYVHDKRRVPRYRSSQTLEGLVVMMLQSASDRAYASTTAKAQ